MAPRIKKPQIEALMERFMSHFGPNCVYCGTDLELEMARKPNSASHDHIVCRADGGSDDLSNLTVSCRRCNTSKGNFSIASWRPGIDTPKSFEDIPEGTGPHAVEYARCRVVLVVPSQFVERVNVWRRAQPKLGSFAEAVRILAERGSEIP